MQEAVVIEEKVLLEEVKGRAVLIAEAAAKRGSIDGSLWCEYDAKKTVGPAKTRVATDQRQGWLAGRLADFW
jgi:hypothetical protein